MNLIELILKMKYNIEQTGRTPSKLFLGRLFIPILRDEIKEHQELHNQAFFSEIPSVFGLELIHPEKNKISETYIGMS